MEKKILRCSLCKQKICTLEDRELAFAHNSLVESQNLKIKYGYVYDIDENANARNYNINLEQQIDGAAEAEGGCNVFAEPNSPTCEDVDIVVENAVTQSLSNTWSSDTIYLLIATYQDFFPKFKSPQYNAKQVWELISAAMRESHVIKDANKCSEKWRNLKKTYEKSRKHNKQTGNNRKVWEFYEVPTINPVSTVSSTGRITKRVSETDDPNLALSVKPDHVRRLDETAKSRITMNKRKAAHIDDSKERRHQERLEQKERMFNWFKNHLTEKGDKNE